MTAPLLEYGCFDGAICSAGGYVLCDGQLLVDLPMEPEQCSGLSAVLEQHGVDYTLESRDETFAGPKMTARWKFTADAPDKPLNSEAARWRKAMQDGMSLTPLSRYDGQPIYKIVYIAEHLHDLDEAKRLYQDQFVFCESNLDTMDDGMMNGELINRKFDKAHTVHAVSPPGDQRHIHVAVALFCRPDPAFFLQPVEKIQHRGCCPAGGLELLADVPPRRRARARPHRKHHLFFRRRKRPQGIW